LAEVERRVAALENQSPRAAPPPRGQWWLLDRLAGHTGEGWERDGVAGAIAFGGRVRTPGSGDVMWQVEQPAHAALDGNIEAATTVLAALGHPVRLTLLRALLRGATSLADLMELPDMGTTGQLTHHLRELRAAGLVVSARRNHYAVAPDRVVPVLITIAAALGSISLTDNDEGKEDS